MWLFLAPSSIFQLPPENVGIRTVLRVPASGSSAQTLSNQQDHFQCQCLGGGRGGGRRNPWQQAVLHQGPSALGFTLFSQLQKPASVRAHLFSQAVSQKCKKTSTCTLQDSCLGRPGLQLVLRLFLHRANVRTEGLTATFHKP